DRPARIAEGSAQHGVPGISPSRPSTSRLILLRRQRGLALAQLPPQPPAPPRLTPLARHRRMLRQPRIRIGKRPLPPLKLARPLPVDERNARTMQRFQTRARRPRQPKILDTGREEFVTNLLLCR